MAELPSRTLDQIYTRTHNRTVLKSPLRLSPDTLTIYPFVGSQQLSQVRSSSSRIPMRIWTRSEIESERQRTTSDHRRPLS